MNSLEKSICDKYVVAFGFIDQSWDEDKKAYTITQPHTEIFWHLLNEEERDTVLAKMIVSFGMNYHKDIMELINARYRQSESA